VKTIGAKKRQKDGERLVIKIKLRYTFGKYVMKKTLQIHGFSRMTKA